jgi:hypothetical protein
MSVESFDVGWVEERNLAFLIKIALPISWVSFLNPAYEVTG